MGVGPISFDEAMDLLGQATAPLGTETVALANGAGRTLASDVVARLPSPRFTVSAMDGYAVRIGDVVAGQAMPVAGEARPGHPHAEPLAQGETVRIFTGGPLPDGADCVIMQEYAAREGPVVRFSEGFGPSRHIRETGSDFAAGDVLVQAGTRLDARTLVAVAAADVGEVYVHRRPKCAILSTGDELAEPGTASEHAHAIPDSIGAALAAMVEQAGGMVATRTRALDDLPALELQAGDLLQGADLVVVTGGASVGDRDFAKPMFAAHGLDLVFDKVAIKPGKPVWLGRAEGSLVLGLPGNPTSAMVTARLFLLPLLDLLQGGAGGHVWRTMPLVAPLPAVGDRETFVRAAWEADGLRPLGNQDSGVQGGLARADWLVRCPAGQDEIASGCLVSALPWTA